MGLEEGMTQIWKNLGNVTGKEEKKQKTLLNEANNYNQEKCELSKKKKVCVGGAVIKLLYTFVSIFASTDIKTSNLL